MATKKSWVLIGDGSLPIMKKHPQHSHLFSESEPLLIKYSDNGKEKAVAGYCRQYLQDNNAPHIQAKKGDYYFAGTDGQKIEKPLAYFPLAGLVALLEPETAAVSQKSAMPDPKK